MKESDRRDVGRIFQIAAEDDLGTIRTGRRNNQRKRVGIDRYLRVRRQLSRITFASLHEVARMRSNLGSQ